MDNNDLYYIELAKEFLSILEICVSQNTGLFRCNNINDRLCKHEQTYINHVKIDWSKSTSKEIALI